MLGAGGATCDTKKVSCFEGKIDDDDDYILPEEEMG